MDDNDDSDSRRGSLQPGNDTDQPGKSLKRTSSLSPRPRPGHEIRRHPSDRLSPVPDRARRLSSRGGRTFKRRDDSRRLKSLPCIAALTINMSLLVRQFQTVSGEAGPDADLLKLALESNDVTTVSRVLDHHYDLFNVDYDVTTATGETPSNRVRKLSDSLSVHVLLNQSKALIGKLEKAQETDDDDEGRDGRAVPNIYHNALHLAVLNGAADVVRLLLKCGVDPNCEGLDVGDRYNYRDRRFSASSDGSEKSGYGASGRTPEHGSNNQSSSNTIRDFFLKPVLFLAIRMGNPMVVKMLLSYGARVDGKDKEGQSPLHVAASVLSERWECAVQLLEYGARILEPDDNGHRPVDSAPGLTLLQLRVVQDTLDAFNPHSITGEESPSHRRSSSRDSRKVSLGLLAIPRLVARVTRSRSPAHKERSNTICHIPSSQHDADHTGEDTFHDKRVRKTSLWGWLDRRRKSRDDIKHMEDQCDSNTSSTRTLGGTQGPTAGQGPTVPQEILVNGENIDGAITQSGLDEGELCF